MNRSAGLQPAYDPHQGFSIQLKEKVNLGANVQSRSQTGAPVTFMVAIRIQFWRSRLPMKRLFAEIELQLSQMPVQPVLLLMQFRVRA